MRIDSLGLAPARTPQQEVTFSTPAALSNGRFTGTLDASGLPAGPYDVWARGCLGSTCGTASTRVDI